MTTIQPPGIGTGAEAPDGDDLPTQDDGRVGGGIVFGTQTDAPVITATDGEAEEERRKLPPQVRLKPRAFRPVDYAVALGSAASSGALTWLLFFRFLPFDGGFGFVLVWWVLFLLVYALVERQIEGRLAAADRVAAVVVGSAAVALLVPMIAIIGYVVFKGLPTLWENVNFLTETGIEGGPEDPLSQGGAWHAIVGTLQQVGMAVLISVPLGIMTAVYLNEVRGRMRRIVRMLTEAMSGVPSIVAGLFIYTSWIIRFGRGPSGFAAALALSVLMLPTVTRTSEEVLRLVPGGLREAALAMGAPEWRSVWRVVLPTARAGIVTAAILGVARAVGETAPLIVTTYGSSFFNGNPFDGQQAALPLYVWELVRLPGDNPVARAWAGALVLLAMVLILFVIARLVGSRSLVKR